MPSPADRLVWIDCEMTGLNPETDRLVEIAVVVTDYDLTPVHPGLDLVIHADAEALAGMGDFVRTMHQTSGLLDEIPNGVPLAEAEQSVIAYVREHVGADQRPPLAGNSIGTDRGFITRYMPALDEVLHYRSVDVSSIKELAKRWFPRAYFNSPPKNGGHRALADIHESIRELAYYRRAVFNPEPGLTTAELVQVSSEVRAAYAAAAE